ncbi:type II secretion system protein [Candidatus Saccharibacteria bacterium]|nr:type II secretion system protein [Candidatus Saccharibacteria bacterium]
MKIRTNKFQKGFTIIEVMIVLAIAGVIIAAVLIAVPQLQKNQRNSSRRAILGRVKTEIDNYIGNNNGTVPSSNAFASSNNCSSATPGTFVTKYLNPTSSFTDPNGSAVSYCVWSAAGNLPANASGSTAAAVMYAAGHICSGESLDTTGTSRQYAVAIGLEGGATYCLDNQ